MDKKIKAHELKEFSNRELYKNEFCTVCNLVVHSRNKNHSVSFFREPYTSDNVAIVLPYIRKGDRIKVLVQKRIIPYWNNTNDELIIPIYAPYSSDKKTMKEEAVSVIEHKTGYEIEDIIEYKGSLNIYPKLATKVHLYLADVSKKVRIHDPYVHIEEIFLDDETFKPEEPFLQILMDMLRKETAIVEVIPEKLTFSEKYNTYIKTAFVMFASAMGAATVGIIGAFFR